MESLDEALEENIYLTLNSKFKLWEVMSEKDRKKSSLITSDGELTLLKYKSSMQFHKSVAKGQYLP